VPKLLPITDSKPNYTFQIYTDGTTVLTRATELTELKIFPALNALTNQDY
jgi:hypothetical protein